MIGKNLGLAVVVLSVVGLGLVAFAQRRAAARQGRATEAGPP